MNSKHLKADFNFAWPSAEIAVMGGPGAVNIIHRKEIASAESPEEKRTELLDAYKNTFLSPFRAADLGYIDAIIDPVETRKILVRTFSALEQKRDRLPPKKHGNIPL